jgi:hypothetical protein
LVPLEIRRRHFIAGLATLVVSPAIVRAASLIPVKALELYDPILSKIVSTGAAKAYRVGDTVFVPPGTYHITDGPLMVPHGHALVARNCLFSFPGERKHRHGLLIAHEGAEISAEMFD